MLEVFTKKENPLDDNLMCIYEKRVSEKPHLVFMVDRRNFKSDYVFNEFVTFTLNALNKNI